VKSAELVCLEAVDLGPIGDHERHVPFPQEVDHVRREPAFVAELDPCRSPAGNAQAPPRAAGGRGGKSAAAARGVTPAWPSAREARSARAEARVLLGLAEPLHVRQVSADLDGEHETGRRLLDPARHGFGLRQPVEGRVQLDRVEVAGVVVEPEALRTARTEDAVSPVGRISSPSSRSLQHRQRRGDPATQLVVPGSDDTRTRLQVERRRAERRVVMLSESSKHV
jgi:hypothetical protein